jgi:hypothetical protein
MMNLMSGVRREVVTPQQYLIDAGAGFGAFFGINKGGAWEFYGNWPSRPRRSGRRSAPKRRDGRPQAGRQGMISDET